MLCQRSTTGTIHLWGMPCTHCMPWHMGSADECAHTCSKHTRQLQVVRAGCVVHNGVACNPHRDGKFTVIIIHNTTSPDTFAGCLIACPHVCLINKVDPALTHQSAHVGSCLLPAETSGLYALKPSRQRSTRTCCRPDENSEWPLPTSALNDTGRTLLAS